MNKLKALADLTTHTMIILFILLVVLALPQTVEAQDKADSLTIKSVTCFRHLIEENDMLIMVHYDIAYSGTLPDENADELYMIRMFDSGTEVAIDIPYSIGAQRGFNEGVGGFYWAASGSSPAWGGSYDVVLQGNPTVWGDVEDWKTTTTLGDSNWSNYDTQTENRVYLYLSILEIAEDLEADWSETLIVSGSIGDQLNETGSSYFNGAIPALSFMCPEVFSVVDIWPNWPSGEWEREYAESIADTVDDSPIGDLVEVIERNLSISYIAAGSIFVFICFGIVVFLTYARCGGQGDEGILVGLPVLMMGVRLGLLSMSAWAIMVVTLILLVGYILFFRHG